MPFPTEVDVVIDPILAFAMGFYPNQISGLAAGYLSTSAVTAKPVLASTYTPQTSNAQRSIVSTSANDASAGTGAQKVLITYLNVSMGSYETETITLNGTTAVNTVGTDYCFLESMKVTQVGTGGGNAGTINFMTTTAGGGSAWGVINTGDNQTYWAHHYVISGRTCFAKSMTGSNTAVAGQLYLTHSGNPTSTNLPTQFIGTYILHGFSSTGIGVDHDFYAPTPIVGPDRIILNEKPGAATASTTYAMFEWFQF